MRTVIFIGLIFIANSINSEIISDFDWNCITIIVGIAIVMDIFEFLKKMGQKNK